MANFLEHGSSKKHIGEDEFKYKFRQFLMASTGVLLGVNAGVIFGYSSVIFTQLRTNADFHITTEQEGWIGLLNLSFVFPYYKTFEIAASVLTLAMIPTNVSIGWFLDKFGRRYTACLTEMMGLSCFITTCFARSYNVLIAARILSGIYVGTSVPTYLTYIGEITSPKYRAVCIVLRSVGASLGTLLVQYLGNYVHWNIMALIFAIPPLYNLVVLCCVKESYIWYINKNNLREAKKAFVWFKGTSEESNEEFSKATENMTGGQSYSLCGVISIITRRSFLIPFIITNVTYMTSQFTTGVCLTFYTSNILALVTKNEDYQYYTNILINVFCLLAIFISTLLVRKISVRIIVLVNTYILGAIVLILSLFLFLSGKDSENQVLSIIALLCIILIGLLASMGLGGMESVVCGELYPASVRGLGCSLATTMSSLYMFFMVKLTPELLENVGGSGYFGIFGILTLIGTIVLQFTLPNTKNKTLKEIESIFSK